MGLEMDSGGFLANLHTGEQLMLTPRNMLSRAWALAEPLLKKTWDEGWEDKYSLETLYDRLAKGECQLWMVNDKDKFFYCLITELLVFEFKTVCYLGYFGVEKWEDAERVMPFITIVEDWARDIQVDRIVVQGRRAFSKKLRPLGYYEKQVVLWKDISPVKEGNA